MTREEARKAAEVMMAYADGKEIEIFNSIKEWKISQCPAFNWGECHYRIKKEPTYRPFKGKKEPTYRPFKGKEECWAEMQKHQPFGWVMAKEAFRQVLIIGNYYICLEGITFDYNEAFEEVKFLDGTPFGIMEE